MAGGLNLYGYANGDPVNLSDPFGLCPKFLTGVPCPKVNVVKVGVGAVNITRGIIGLSAGAATTSLGVGATVTLGPVGGPALAIGSAQIFFGAGNLNRGLQQFSEGIFDGDDPAFRNLLGLAPFGQKFDDTDEATPLEFATDLFRDFVTSPASTLKDLIAGFLALDGEGN